MVWTDWFLERAMVIPGEAPWLSERPVPDSWQQQVKTGVMAAGPQRRMAIHARQSGHGRRVASAGSGQTAGACPAEDVQIRVSDGRGTAGGLERRKNWRCTP